MANYKTIHYVREAVKLEVPDTPSSIPPSISVDGSGFPVYRDPSGLYLLVNTKYGRTRANEGQWVVLMEPSVPEVPATPEVKAKGSFTVASDAAGDGEVGFRYLNAIYTVSTPIDQSPETTAQLLADLVNQNTDATAVVVGTKVDLFSLKYGTNGNYELMDLTTDTGQTGNIVGITGGEDATSGVPEIPAVFEIYNEDDFFAVYELES